VSRTRSGEQRTAAIRRTPRIRAGRRMTIHDSGGTPACQSLPPSGSPPPRPAFPPGLAMPPRISHDRTD
jgi:hypothetical protein